MKRGILPLILLVALSVMFSRTAVATNFNMTCTVANSALVMNSLDPLNYLPNKTPITAPTGTITVSCTSTHPSSSVTVSYTITLNTTPLRQLASGTDKLDYDLYTDSTTTNEWNTTGPCGNGHVICGSLSVPAKSSASKNESYWAKVPTLPTSTYDVPVGTYVQTLGVTLTYSCSPAPTGSGVC